MPHCVSAATTSLSTTTSTSPYTTSISFQSSNLILPSHLSNDTSSASNSTSSSSATLSKTFIPDPDSISFSNISTLNPYGNSNVVNDANVIITQETDAIVTHGNNAYAYAFSGSPKINTETDESKEKASSHKSFKIFDCDESNIESKRPKEDDENSANDYKKDGKSLFLQDFDTPITSNIRHWLKSIQTIGFIPCILEKYITNDISEEDQPQFCSEYIRIFDPYYDILPDEISEIEGNVVNGVPNGECILQLKNGDEVYGNFVGGVRQGRGYSAGTNLQKYGIKRISGNYRDGILSGYGKAVMMSGGWVGENRLYLDGVFNDSYLEGPVRGLDEKGNLILVGSYSKGIPKGYCWCANEGQSWLFGRVDDKGQFTGKDIMFVYPDFQTSLYGEFQNSVMIKAQASQIVSTSINEVDILCLQILKPSTSQENFSFSPSDSTAIKCNWMLQDSYEKVTVQCCQSQVDGAGDGLFALRDIPADTVISYYNGLRLKQNEKYTSDSGDNYQIYIDFGDTDASPFIDIPYECIEISNYCASLAHKANHSFDPNCQFLAVNHPRFGRIPALKTIVPVKKGEELFTHYKYDIALAAGWYQLAWEKFNQK